MRAASHIVGVPQFGGAALGAHQSPEPLADRLPAT